MNFPGNLAARLRLIGGDFGPILWRELSQIAARRRFRALKWSLAAVLALIMFGFWQDMSYRLLDTGAFPADEVRDRFYFIVVLLTVVLSLWALLACSLMVVSEYVRKTVVFLLISPLSSSAILGSKIGSMLLQGCVGLAIALPLAVLMSAFGGIDIWTISGGLVIVLTNVWLYGAIGIFASVVSRNVPATVAKALAFVVLLNVLDGWYFLWLLLRWRGFPPVPFLAAVSANPLLVVMFLPRSAAPGLTLLCHCAFNIAVGMGFYLMAVRFFRPRALAIVSAVSTSRELRRPAPLARPRADRARLSGIAMRLFGPGMLSKELASSGLWLSLLTPALFALFWVVALLPSIVFRYSLSALVDLLTRPNVNMTILALEACVLAFLLIVSASIRISSERKKGTLQILAMTSFGSFHILAGKAAAVLVSQAPGIAFFLAHGAWIVLCGIVPAYLWGLFVMSLVLFLANAVLLGLYASLPSRKSLTSVALAFLLCFAGTLVPLMIIPIQGTHLEYIVAVPAAVAVLLFFVIFGKAQCLEPAWYVISYCAALVLSFVFLDAVFHTTARAESYVLFLIAVLPVSSAMWGTQRATLPVAVYLLPLQVAVFLWTIWVCLFTFDSQVRRPD